MTFQKGDRVTIPEHRVTDVLSDNLLELADGNGINQATLEDAVYHQKPFIIDHEEEGGYVLKLGRKFLYGIHEAEDLIKYEKTEQT